MVFSSLLFLFLFLPVFLAVYHAVPEGRKNLVLLVFSILFYIAGEPGYVYLMVVSSLVDYTAGRLIGKYQGSIRIRQAALGLSLAVNLSFLGFFKYYDFFVQSFNRLTGFSIPLLGLSLPLGISFYTFQTMSYTIDCYRGKTGVQKNPVTFGAYVASFPQLIAGPIVTYADVEEEMDHRKAFLAGFTVGLERFITGLFKKAFLANQIGLLWETVKAQGTDGLSALSAWIGILAFAFQIYFDFSGYSDMAIGLGRMIGFHFPENFLYPYLSESATEFFRRWHITLGRWFREYVYIPLGGSRNGGKTTARNLLVVWFLTGLWHGASWNFVVWGMFFGFLILLEKSFLIGLLGKLPRAVRRGYLWLMVLISWVFFANDTLPIAWSYLTAMFGSSGWLSGQALYDGRNYIVLLLLGAAAATPWPKHCYDRFPKGLRYICCLVLFGISVAYLVDASYNPFLYFRF